MKIAIMQPYIFPYIGYFQLVSTVDVFVFYDDVNFIKKGWINRNNILVNGKSNLFTVPLLKASQNNTIKDTLINSENFIDWKNKFAQTIVLNYKKAPFFSQVHNIIMDVIDQEHKSISDMAVKSIVAISKYLGFKTEFHLASERYHNQSLNRQDRLIDICKKESADHYINALGGQELYDKEDFLKSGVKLDFLKPLEISYKQFNSEFVPWLSILDILMFNSIDDTNDFISQYELI